LGDLNVDERTILKEISKMKVVRVGFIWLRIGSRSGML
jgi:hypothetical protein